MSPHRLTRRHALRLGAASTLIGALRPGRAAAAAPDAFELDLSAHAGEGPGWHTTPILDAPHRFDLVGLRWARGSQAEAHVRARRRGGGWTPWTALPDGGDHGPDAGRPGAGTEPAWTGAADQLQLRLKGRPRALRACFVHAAPAARSARRRAPLARVAAKRQAGAPAIIPRAVWGADTYPPRAAPSFGQVQLAFVHHTVTANEYGPEQSAAIVLGILRYHRNTRGWNDVGYNFLVDRYGQIFEGRAGGIDQAIVGAQAQGFNSVSTGIACIGTFTSVTQTEAGMDALARLIAWKLSLHAVPVQGEVVVPSLGGEANRFPSGTPVTFERISGHRDGGATSCPGDRLYAQLADLRARAATYAGQPSAGVTLRASATRVRGPGDSVISGTLKFADAGPPAGARVEVLFAPPGAAYTLLAVTSCAADGKWSVPVRLPQTGSLRARFPGDGVRPPLESGAVSVTVLPTVALGLSARRVRRGRRVVASGVVAPAVAGTSVSLYLQRRVGRRWVTVRRRTVLVRGGRFLRRLGPLRPGLYRVSVGVSGAVARSTFRVLR